VKFLKVARRLHAKAKPVKFSKAKPHADGWKPMDFAIPTFGQPAPGAAQRQRR